MAEQWQMICKVDEIPMLGVRVVERGLAWQELPGVAIFRTGDNRIFGLLDLCPHPDGGRLSQGLVCGEQVLCPLHGIGVALDSGHVVAPATGCARPYKVRVEQGNVYMDMNELRAPASRAEAALAGLFATMTHV